jgi:glucose-1-phosphate thymidylyltransferase
MALISRKFKGVILAGGQGTRLYPLTKVVNKHLLPVYDKPMIFYPLLTLINSGISDIHIVTAPGFKENFEKITTDFAKEHQINLSFSEQSGFGGIAQALNCARDFIASNPAAVILGDNIFQDNFLKEIENFNNSNAHAQVFLSHTTEPERFGVAQVNNANEVLQIDEKPQKPVSNWAVTGFYLYKQSLFQAIDEIKPSARGELEITDVNNWYINNSTLKAAFVNGYWVDAGTFESLFEASSLFKKAAL